MLNHNIETVARLQRAVRPSAGYARSLAVLARAGAAGLVTKSGLMVGLGEREDEVVATMADLRAVGVSIVTIGQYLRPSRDHLPVARYWAPEEFERLREVGADWACPTSRPRRSPARATTPAKRLRPPVGEPEPGVLLRRGRTPIRRVQSRPTGPSSPPPETGLAGGVGYQPAGAVAGIGTAVGKGSHPGIGHVAGGPYWPFAAARFDRLQLAYEC